MLDVLFVAASLAPLAAMLACLFAAVWLSESPQERRPAEPARAPR